MATATQLGYLLKLYRLHHGLFQTDLSTRIGVTAKTISRWETGAVTPLPEQHERILAALHEADSPTKQAFAAALAPAATAEQTRVDQMIAAGAAELAVNSAVLRATFRRLLTAAAGADLSLERLRELV